MKDTSFKDKHIIVTGGTNGIGKACVDVFLREGAKVSVLDIDKPSLLTKEQKRKCAFYKVNVAKEKEVKKGIEAAIKKFGDIAVLVNNAGIIRYAPVAETTEELWDFVMDVNLKSAFLCAKHAIPSMQRKAGGVVVNVASVQAFLSQGNAAAYTTSKSALLGLTRSIAIDYAPNIRCVAVCPGSVDTPMLQNAIQGLPNPEEAYRECEDMHLVKKIAKAEDVGELVAYLSSPKASFITGQAFRIDGGLGIAVAH